MHFIKDTDVFVGMATTVQLLLSCQVCTISLILSENRDELEVVDRENPTQ